MRVMVDPHNARRAGGGGWGHMACQPSCQPVTHSVASSLSPNTILAPPATAAGLPPNLGSMLKLRPLDSDSDREQVAQKFELELNAASSEPSPSPLSLTRVAGGPRPVLAPAGVPGTRQKPAGHLVPAAAPIQPICWSPYSHLPHISSTRSCHQIFPG